MRALSLRSHLRFSLAIALLTLGLNLTTTSASYAQAPPPTIEGFRVTWVEADASAGTYTFTFTGTAKNLEGLVAPAIEIDGYPFGGFCGIGPNGEFSYAETLHGDVAFGRSITAVITDSAVPVSLPAYTST